MPGTPEKDLPLVKILPDPTTGEGNYEKQTVRLRLDFSGSQEVDPSSIVVDSKLKGRPKEPELLKVWNKRGDGPNALFDTTVNPALIKEPYFPELIKKEYVVTVEAAPKAKGKTAQPVKQKARCRVRVALLRIGWKSWALDVKGAPVSKDQPVEVVADGESGFRLRLDVEEWEHGTSKWEVKTDDYQFSHFLAPKDELLSSEVEIDIEVLDPVPRPWELKDPKDPQIETDWYSAAALPSETPELRKLPPPPFDSFIRVHGWPKGTIVGRQKNRVIKKTEDAKFVAQERIPLHFVPGRIKTEIAEPELPIRADKDNHEKGVDLRLRLTYGGLAWSKPAQKLKISWQYPAKDKEAALGGRCDPSTGTTDENGELTFKYFPPELFFEPGKKYVEKLEIYVETKRKTPEKKKLEEPVKIPLLPSLLIKLQKKPYFVDKEPIPIEPDELSSIEELFESGGTLFIRPAAYFFKGPGEDVVFSEKPIKDVTWLLGPQETESKGKYIDDKSGYELKIPPPEAAGEGGGEGTFQIDPEIRIPKQIEKQLQDILLGSKELDRSIESTLADKADEFTKAVLDYLTEKDSKELDANKEKVDARLLSVPYFLKYSNLAAQAFKTSLKLHDKAYKRFVENLVAAFIELIFLFGEKYLEKAIDTGKRGLKEYLEKMVANLPEQAVRRAKALLEGAMDKVKPGLATLQKTADALKEKAEKAFSGLKKNVEEMAAQRKALLEIKDQKKTADDAIKRLEQTLGETESRFKEAEAGLEQIGERDHFIKGLEKDKKELDDEILKLDEALKDTESGFKEAEAGLDKIGERDRFIKGLEKDKKELDDEILELDKALKDTEGRFKEAEAGLNKMKETDGVIKGLEKDKKELDDAIRQLEEKMERTKEQADKAIAGLKEIDETQLLLDELNNTKRNLDDAIKRLQDKLTQTEGQAGEAAAGLKKIDDADQALKQAQKDKKTIEEEIRKLETTLNSTKLQADNAADRIKTITREIEEQKKLLEAEGLSPQDKKGIEEKIGRLEQEQGTLNEVVRSFEENQRAVLTKKEEITALGEKITETEQTIERLNRDKAKWTDTVETFESNKETLAAKQKEKTILESKMVKTQESVKGLKQNQPAWQQTVEVFRKDQQDLVGKRGKSATLGGEISGKQDELSALKQQESTWKSTVDTYRETDRQLKSSQRQSTALEGEIGTQQDELGTLKQQESTWKSTVDAYNETDRQLKSSQRQSAALGGEIGKQQDELNEWKSNESTWTQTKETYSKNESDLTEAKKASEKLTEDSKKIDDEIKSLDEKSQAIRGEVKSAMEELHGPGAEYLRNATDEAIIQEWLTKMRDLETRIAGMTTEQAEAALKELSNDEAFVNLSKQIDQLYEKHELWIDKWADALRNLPEAERQELRIDELLSSVGKMKEELKSIREARDARFEVYKTMVGETMLEDKIKEQARKIKETVQDFKEESKKYPEVRREDYDPDWSGSFWYALDYFLSLVDTALSWTVRPVFQLLAWLFSPVIWIFVWAVSKLAWILTKAADLLITIFDKLTGSWTVLPLVLYRDGKKFLLSRAKCDAEFFKFVPASEKELLNRLKPAKLKQDGYLNMGKEQSKAALKSKFEGAYKEYYVAQWTRARVSLENLCVEALNKEAIGKEARSPNAFGQGHQPSFVLLSITRPMENYEYALNSADENGVFGTSAISLAYRATEGKFNPLDLDVLIDWLNWVVAWGLRTLAILAIPLGTVTGGASLGIVGPALKYADYADRVCIVIRCGVTASCTMPDILGYQFDVLISGAVAYEALFADYKLPAELVSESRTYQLVDMLPMPDDPSAV